MNTFNKIQVVTTSSQLNGRRSRHLLNLFLTSHRQQLPAHPLNHQVPEEKEMWSAPICWSRALASAGHLCPRTAL